MTSLIVGLKNRSTPPSVDIRDVKPSGFTFPDTFSSERRFSGRPKGGWGLGVDFGPQRLEMRTRTPLGRVGVVVVVHLVVDIGPVSRTRSPE